MLNNEQTRQAGWEIDPDVAALTLDGARGTEPTAAPAATSEPGYLLFRCAGLDCAAPLDALREVLPRCPVAMPLPHSPEWLMGVFALRAGLVGLADPAPLLLGGISDDSQCAHDAALVAGAGERVLAWAVESIGATAPLAREASQESDDTPGDIPVTEHSPDGQRLRIAAPYAAGVIGLASGQRYTVIDVETLLSDMLRALEERPAGA